MTFVEGVRDLLPKEIAERKWVYGILRSHFSRRGYQEVATPTLESLDLYLGGDDVYLQEQLFKVVDEKGQILVLKPDVTLPIARMAATRYTKIPKPWKFSYITTAYQANGGQSARMKEKTQAGIELLGRSDIFADVEVIATLIQSLQAVGIKEPLIDLGQATFVQTIFASLEITESAKNELRTLMEEKNIAAIEEWSNRYSLKPDQREILVKLPGIFGSPQAVLAELRDLSLPPGAEEVLVELEETYQYLQAMGLSQYIAFDPAMVTQLGYYTGMIFKAYVNGYGEVVAQGGRYDGLAQQFGQDVAAVGFAIEIERLLNCLRTAKINLGEPEEKFLLYIKEPTDFIRGYQLARLLQRQGLMVELYWGENIQEYMEFYQMTYQGHWDLDLFYLQDNQKNQVTLTGDVSLLTMEIINWLEGGGQV